MAITNTAVTVGSTATSVAAIDQTRRRIILHNPNSTTIFVGGSGVTAANGHPLLQNTTLEIVQQHREDASPHQEWYAIVSTGTQPLRVTTVAN
jgi:hypothetical protein